MTRPLLSNVSHLRPLSSPLVHRSIAHAPPPFYVMVPLEIECCGLEGVPAFALLPLCDWQMYIQNTVQTERFVVHVPSGL